MIAEAIKKVVKKEDLTYQEARQVMDEIMSGNATPVQEASWTSYAERNSPKAGKP